jgi:hypothetical protein
MIVDDPEMDRVIAETSAALSARIAPSQVVTRAGTMLRMVRQGLRDMQETDQDRILLGFLAVVVFGRSMTLVMQNLRKHDQEAFDRWYSSWQEEMKGDPLMRYFYTLRTMVIHHDAPAISVLLYGYGENMPPLGSITVDGLPPPERHLDQPLADTSMANLCRLYLAYLQRMFESFTPVAFAVQDRLLSEQPANPALNPTGLRPAG